jgi:TonB-like protein
MRPRFLIALMLPAIAAAAEPHTPSAIYIVSDFWSDHGGLNYYRVIDATQEGSDAVIRYSRVAPINVYCPRLIVQSTQVHKSWRDFERMIKGNNPCAVSPNALKSAIAKFRKFGVFETQSLGITVQCGASEITLQLPDALPTDLKRLDPKIGRLWQLTSDITHLAFGNRDVFHDQTEEDDLALQRAGESMLPVIISRRYDAALAAAVGKGWKDPSFRSLLEDYRGPVSAKDAEMVKQARLRESFEFNHYVAAKYPPLAMQARIQGIVELQLKVNMATGEVLDAAAVSGHQLLVPSAIEAAREWRFAPQSVHSESLRVTLDYGMHCP